MSVSSLSSEDIPESELEIGATVGHGTFGVVKKALWRGELVAVKEFAQSDIPDDSFLNEIEALKKVDHENIIKLIGYAAGPRCLIVMELAENGNLYDLLHGDQTVEYNIHHALSWCLQSAKALAYLHRQTPPLVHRDFKPPNLLLMDECRKIKVCDFGIACDVHSHMTSNRGTTYWMAPEVFMDHSYSEQCDTFSFGITVWEILARKKPLADCANQFQVMWAVSTGSRPPLLTDCPKVLEKLITRCWDQTPTERPRMASVEALFEKLVEYVSLGEALTPIHVPDKKNESFNRLESSFIQKLQRLQTCQTETEPVLNNGIPYNNPQLYDFLGQDPNAKFTPFRTSATSPPVSQVNIHPQDHHAIHRQEKRVLRPAPAPPVSRRELPLPSTSSHLLHSQSKSCHRRTGSFDSPPETDENVYLNHHYHPQISPRREDAPDLASGSLSKSKSLTDNSILGSSPDSRDQFGSSSPSSRQRYLSQAGPSAPRRFSTVIHHPISFDGRTIESPEDDGYRTLTDNAYLSQVDPKYRPFRPDPTNEKSIALFEEHKKYCKMYAQKKVELTLLDEEAKEMPKLMEEVLKQGGFFSLDDEMMKTERDWRALKMFRDNLKTQLQKIIVKKESEDATRDGFVYVRNADDL